ncbi:MAG: copper resistance CopC family protein [Actinomycetaceae bacterium]
MSHAVATPVRTSARHRGRLRSAVVALLAALALALTASPALAHDTLISSDPAEGATLEEAPTEAVLTFSAELTPSGAIAVLQDADGTETELEEPTYDGRDAIWELPEVDGEQTLVWSVISSDGHRIEGETPFTVDAATSGDETPSEDETTSDTGAGTSGDDAAGGATGAEDDDADADGSDGATDDGAADEGATNGGADTAAPGEGSGSDSAGDEAAEDTAADTTAEDEDGSGSGATPWIIGGIALVVIAGTVIWFVARRDRGTDGQTED